MNSLSVLFNKFLSFIIAAFVAAALFFAAGSTPAMAQDKPVDTANANQQTVQGVWQQNPLYFVGSTPTPAFCAIIKQCDPQPSNVSGTKDTGTSEDMRRRRVGWWKKHLEEFNKLLARVEQLERDSKEYRERITVLENLYAQMKDAVERDIKDLKIRDIELQQQLDDLKMRVTVLERRVDDHEERISFLESFIQGFSRGHASGGFGLRASLLPGLIINAPTYTAGNPTPTGTAELTLQQTGQLSLGLAGFIGFELGDVLMGFDVSGGLGLAQAEGINTPPAAISLDGSVSLMFYGAMGDANAFYLGGGVAIFGGAEGSTPSSSSASYRGAGLKLGSRIPAGNHFGLSVGLILGYATTDYEILTQDDVSPSINSTNYSNSGVHGALEISAQWGVF